VNSKYITGFPAAESRHALDAAPLFTRPGSRHDPGDKVVVEFQMRHKTMTVRAEYLKIA
jgi:hypothetical protein